MTSACNATLVAFAERTAEAISAPPCFFSKVCLQRSAVEKAGRSVCLGCAARLRGMEYPLRAPSIEPLYITGHSASEALDMVESS